MLHQTLPYLELMSGIAFIHLWMIVPFLFCFQPIFKKQDSLIFREFGPAQDHYPTRQLSLKNLGSRSGSGSAGGQQQQQRGAHYSRRPKVKQDLLTKILTIKVRIFLLFFFSYDAANKRLSDFFRLCTRLLY